MSIQQALEKLKLFTCNVPADALEAVRTNWSGAEPLLLAELDWQIENPLEEERSALFIYALCLCAEMKCEAAFVRYVSILRMPTALLNAMLGDMLTETMPEMLTRTCAGRIDELKALIEDERVYDFARVITLDVLRNLMLDGVISRDDLTAYVSQLLVCRLERERSHVWDAAASLAENLHMTDALPAIEEAYRAGFCDPGYQSLESIQSGLRTQTAEEALLCAERGRRRFSTIEKEMSFFVKRWPANGVFPEEDDRELLTEPREVQKRSRRVVKEGPGRNDSCPCGSGKKYKKCCINLGFDPSAAALEAIPEPLSPANDWMGAGYYYHGKRYFGSALTCWRNCWREVLKVLPSGVSDPQAGIGLDALPPVRKAIGSGFETKTITLSCGKLTTGVTVSQWSSILMLRNLKSPETYFQAAFRVQSPWSIKNPNGDNPSEEEILKPACFVFDFAPTRALRQLSEYGIGLSPNEPNPENAVKDLVSFLPVLAYDGANMTQIDAGGILDIAMAGTSATLLAKKWQSAVLVNVDNGTLRRILDNPEAMAAVERIEGWRSLGDKIIETIINKSEKVKELKNKAKEKDLTAKQQKQLTEEEKEYKSKRKLVQEKLIKFATRIPAFMYLTDFRENTLQDVITKLEPDLFQSVTGLTVQDFHLLVRLKVFNTEQMNQAVFAFRRYEDASLRYTGIESHEGLSHYGLWDTVKARE